ncbi:hypothetical protein [Haloarchaeobius sp. HRN-SO-5]|uniref:hypothetical protein n=1 Tax=Haloarchaeobius sp. HRN-SO-5 TaxID=3446118 RepID=UPI003EC10FF8
MRPDSLWVEWETTDGRRRRERFEPATSVADAHPDAEMVRFAEVYDEDADAWHPVGNEDVVDCRVDMNGVPRSGVEVFRGP